LLTILRARLGNDAAGEWAVTRDELGKINRLRLARLIDEEQQL
jgi:2-oxo-4-hydroxy-4-carboxy--5-ureidoimidazoline (OHCU) decarboxylase